MNSSGVLWKISTENSVSDSLCNWHDEQCSQFTNEFTDGFTNRITDGIYSVGSSVGKNDMSSFFLLCFNFFSHGYSLGIYRGNISIGKIPRKFTDGNIPSVFLFVFINFLLVRVDYELGFMIYFDLLFMRLSKSYNSSYVFCELPEIESSCFIVSCFYIELF